MPQINEYKCTKCGFSLQSGSGGYTYVVDKDGARVPCPHPGESSTIYKVLGDHAPYEVVRERVGSVHYCVCRNCLGQYGLDLKGAAEVGPWVWWFLRADGEADPSAYKDWPTRVRDERRCPSCGSTDVRTVAEMVGERCPKCGIGTIEAIWTGIVT